MDPALLRSLSVDELLVWNRRLEHSAQQVRDAYERGAQQAARVADLYPGFSTLDRCKDEGGGAT